MTIIRRGQSAGRGGRRSATANTAAEISAPRGRSRVACRHGRATGRGSGGPLRKRSRGTIAEICALRGRPGGDVTVDERRGGGCRPPPRTRPRDGHGDRCPTQKAAADDVAGPPWQTPPLADGRAGVSPWMSGREGRGTETRRCGRAPRDVCGGTSLRMPRDGRG